MNRRKFLKNTLLTSLAFLPACKTEKPQASEGPMKVVLIGVDGANWATLDPLIAKGKLPFWKKLKEESAWANLETFKPTKSSVIWTSIATGTRMEKHGILDFTFLNQNNMQVPFTNSERREPAIWQILDELNKKSIICNWFVSHPPDKINGIMASDNFRRVVARPLDRLEEYSDSVYPSIYFRKLLENAERDYATILKKSGLPDYIEMYSTLHPDKNFKDVPILKTFRTMAIQDYFVTDYSKELYRTKDFDFFATYIRMPDLVQHFSARMFDDQYLADIVPLLKNKTLSKEKHDEVISKIADIIEPVYHFAGNLIETMMTFKKYRDAYFIICSDHGFSLYPGGYNHYDLPEDYPAPSGILLMKGPKVIPGPIASASVLDIAPTILNLFDFPIGKNMDGKVLRSAFKLNRQSKYRVYKIPAKDSTGKKSNKAAENDAMDELKSIGYIQ